MIATVRSVHTADQIKGGKDFGVNDIVEIKATGVRGYIGELGQHPSIPGGSAIRLKGFEEVFYADELRLISRYLG